MDNDYVVYIDTDSIFFSIEKWIKNNGLSEKWEKLDQNEKIEYIKKIGKIVEDYTNKRSFEKTQKLHYNSQVDDFSIVFEQEKIAKSALFATKKRYATWTLLDGNKWKDDMSITGLEIIRSDSPGIVKPMIKNVLKMVLNFHPENEIKNYIKNCKKELKDCPPSQIAENKSINNINKYIKNEVAIKGTPHHLKGWLNMKLLLKKFNLEDKYDLPQEATKAKIVYLQKNPYKFESLSFLKWPDEFYEKGIHINYNKMIKNNFIKKLEGLFNVMNKKEIVSTKANLESLFGG